MSASVLESMQVCPTQWFLYREAGGVARAHQSANLGQLLHALAERVAPASCPPGRRRRPAHGRTSTRVWDRLEFRTPWSKAREHERVRAALARFLAWHHANPRELLATEARFETVVELRGEQVELTGYADRLELDADGKVVVVDLKTGRTAADRSGVEAHLQLGLYQYAVDAAPSTAGRRGRRRPPAAPSWCSSGSRTAARRRRAAPGARGRRRCGRRQLRARLARAAGLMRAENFPAVAGPHCRDCSFVPICPIKSAGSVTDR